MFRGRKRKRQSHERVRNLPTRHSRRSRPPPLVFAGFLFAGAIADRYLLAAHFDLPNVVRYAIASALILSALFFLVGALGGFRRARTRAEPWKPTTAIVTGGVYRFTRNPMYVGMALAYSGVASGMDSVLALLLPSQQPLDSAPGASPRLSLRSMLRPLRARVRATRFIRFCPLAPLKPSWSRNVISNDLSSAKRKRLDILLTSFA